MKYALTVNSTGEWNAVQTHIVEDNLAPEETTPNSWKDGGEAMVELLIGLGHGKEEAEEIVKWDDYFIVNCDDVDYTITNPYSDPNTPQNALEREIPDDIPEGVRSLVLKELFNILDLVTCDPALFNDNIDSEIEACAKKGIDLL